MKIGEIYSAELDGKLPLFTRISSLPPSVLDWMGSQMAEVFIIWDEKDRICFVTPSIETMLGFNVMELNGQPWYEVLQPIEPKQMEQALDKNRQEGIRLDLLHKKQHPVYVELLAKKVRLERMGEQYTVVSLKDLTALKETKEIMIQAEKMSAVGQISASLAHEIRNPLTSIKGFLQLLQAGAEHKDEYYRIMEDEIEKIETITSELLFLSKPSSQDMRNEPAGKLIQDVVVLLQSQAMLKNITIHVDGPIQSVIYCARSKIKQVLINLVKNAIEAMDEPGEIRLSVTEDDEYVIIHVKDEGVGIPPDIAEQLSVAFFTTKENGTGLGLSITKEILELHGGYLNFMTNEEKGSTFQLFFPKVCVQKDGL